MAAIGCSVCWVSRGWRTSASHRISSPFLSPPLSICISSVFHLFLYLSIWASLPPTLYKYVSLLRDVYNVRKRFRIIPIWADTLLLEYCDWNLKSKHFLYIHIYLLCILYLRTKINPSCDIKDFQQKFLTQNFLEIYNKNHKIFVS